MNAAVDHVGAALAGDFAQFHAAQSVAGVDADSDDIPGLNALRVKWR